MDYTRLSLSKYTDSALTKTVMALCLGRLTHLIHVLLFDLPEYKWYSSETNIKVLMRGLELRVLVPVEDFDRIEKGLREIGFWPLKLISGEYIVQYRHMDEFNYNIRFQRSSEVELPQVIMSYVGGRFLNVYQQIFN